MSLQVHGCTMVYLASCTNHFPPARSLRPVNHPFPGGGKCAMPPRSLARHLPEPKLAQPALLPRPVVQLEGGMDRHGSEATPAGSKGRAHASALSNGQQAWGDAPPQVADLHHVARCQVHALARASKPWLTSKVCVARTQRGR